MPRNEEGEYELVLGTPQLLSVLFIIVVLFGVVFSLGYFMGRSTAPVSAGPPAQSPAGEMGERTAARPEPAGQALPPSAQTEAAESSQTGQGQPGGAAAAGPAAEQPSGVSSSGTNPVSRSPAEAQTAAATPAPPSAPAAAASYPEPAPGQTFLQVAAVSQSEAEFVADVLKRKGFAALVAPGPNERLFRVLVGPLKDAEEIAKTKKALEEAGFRSAYVRKY